MTASPPQQPGESNAKLYSQKSIAVATYLGGPLAAGILVRQNFINQGNKAYGKQALFGGIAFTLLLVGVLLAVPEDMVASMPSAIIPAVYTAVIYLIVERLQGQKLRDHKQNNRPFYPIWKAAGVGAVFLVVYVLGIVGYAYTAPDDFDRAAYEASIAEIQENEEKALALYGMIDTADVGQTARFIHDTGIPAWDENIKILNRLDTADGIYQEYIDHNQVLRNYCRLYITLYQTIEKALNEDTDTYNGQIKSLNQQIDALREKM